VHPNPFFQQAYAFTLGLPIVGKLLGHSQPATTARYAHLDADPLRRASNIIGDHLLAALASRNSGSKTL
jgi:integrase